MLQEIAAPSALQGVHHTGVSPPGATFGQPSVSPPEPHAGAVGATALLMAPRSDAAEAPKADVARRRRLRSAAVRARRPPGLQEVVSSDYQVCDATGRYGYRSCRMPCAPKAMLAGALPGVWYIHKGVYRCAHFMDKDGRSLRFCSKCRALKLTDAQLLERAARVFASYDAAGLRQEYLECVGSLDSDLVAAAAEEAAGVPPATAQASVGGLDTSERRAASALVSLLPQQDATSPLRVLGPLSHAAELLPPVQLPRVVAAVPSASDAVAPFVLSAGVHVTPARAPVDAAARGQPETQRSVIVDDDPFDSPALSQLAPPRCLGDAALQRRAITDDLVAQATLQHDCAAAANRHAVDFASSVNALLAASPPPTYQVVTTWLERCAALRRFNEQTSELAVESARILAGAQVLLIGPGMDAALAAARNAASIAAGAVAWSGAPPATDTAEDIGAEA